MGQRTQLVIEVTKPQRNYDTGKDVKKTYVGSYHNQWGIGKMQLLDIMMFVNTYFCDCDGGIKFPEKLNKGYLLNGNEYEVPFEGKATPEKVMNWMRETQDNNNGGMLLKVKMDRYGHITSGELYIFNDPETEYCRYTDAHPDEDINWDKFKIERVIRFVEYLNYDPQYFSGERNESFVSAFLSLLRFYNIKIVQPEEIKPIEKKEKTND